MGSTRAKSSLRLRPLPLLGSQISSYCRRPTTIPGAIPIRRAKSTTADFDFSFRRSGVALDGIRRLLENRSASISLELPFDEMPSSIHRSVLPCKSTCPISWNTFALGISLVLAACCDHVLRGTKAYQTLIIWPYAVAPAIAAVLWAFMFNPTVGILAYGLKLLGYDWNHMLNSGQAMVLVVIASVWKQVSYNFLFFLAGLQ